MTLNEAIVNLLRRERWTMATSKIANELNRNKWYTKRDGSLITAFQIHSRTRNYSHLFIRDGTMVSLHDQSIAKPERKLTREKKVITPRLIQSVSAILRNQKISLIQR